VDIFYVGACWLLTICPRPKSRVSIIQFSSCDKSFVFVFVFVRPAFFYPDVRLASYPLILSLGYIMKSPLVNRLSFLVLDARNVLRPTFADTGYVTA
jgi:hypothetical protein